MAGGNDLAKMVPGFEFLQNLMTGAGAAFPGVPGMPGMNQWIAPTLDPAELDKRIQELKTVQFWLQPAARTPPPRSKQRTVRIWQKSTRIWWWGWTSEPRR